MFIERKILPGKLGQEFDEPELELMIRQHIMDQISAGGQLGLISHLRALPHIHGSVSIYTSAVSLFYAPSDVSGIYGVAKERIHATPTWGKKHIPRYDTVYVVAGDDPGMKGLEIARVHLIFSAEHRSKTYACALVQWFSKIGDEPDEITGMWRVEPDLNENGGPLRQVISLDTILRASHLLGDAQNKPLPRDVTYINALNHFDNFYINRYIDHHAYEIAF